MLRSILFLLVSGLFLGVSTAAVAQIYFERNSVEATGDDAIVAVASGNSNIVLVYNDAGQQERYTVEQYRNFIENNRTDLLDLAEAQYRNQRYEFYYTVAIAKYLFDQKNYSASAAMYQRAQNFARGNSEDLEKLSGLVTASYYGSARHKEGLRYICDLYESRPRWDFRYRHAIHAHLRSLAVNMGHEHARAILKLIRNNPKCRRPDFSPVWIPIHLTDMRKLEQSSYMESYGISQQEDRAFAQALLQENIPHGFMDYLHFALGDYDKIIEEYPDSYIYDMALLLNGDNENYEKAKRSLIDYIDRFENNRLIAVSKLLSRSLGAQDVDTYLEYSKKHGADVLNVADASDNRIHIQINNYTRVWTPLAELSLEPAALKVMFDFYHECISFADDLTNGKLIDVYDRVKYYHDQYQQHFPVDHKFDGYFGDPSTSNPKDDYNNRCIIDLDIEALEFFVREFGPAYHAFKSSDPEKMTEVGKRFKLCGDIRERLIRGLHPVTADNDTRLFCETVIGQVDEDRVANAFSFHQISTLLLSKAYELDPFNFSESLFLTGLAYKNNRQYDEAKKSLEDYASFHPDGKYADDALTEIGWIYLSINEDYEKANEFFLKVVDGYEGTNAYDNAVNWLVISNKAAGNVMEAAKYAVQLGALVVSDRIRGKTDDRDQRLLQLENSVGGIQSDIVIGEQIHDDFVGFGFDRLVIIRKAPPDRPELVGLTIYTIDGVAVKDATTAIEIIRVVKDRGEQLVTVNGDVYIETDLFEFE